MSSLNEIKNKLPKSGKCPLCLNEYKGLKLHFNTCYKKNIGSDNSTS